MRDHSGECAPRPGLVQLNSADPDQVGQLLNRFYFPVTLDTPEGVDGFAADVRVIQLGPLTIGELHVGGAPVSLAAAELDGYHVMMPTTGRVVTRQGAFEVTVAPDGAAMFRPGRPAFSLHDAHSSGFALRIERSALEGELSALLGRPASGPIDLPPTMSVDHGPMRSWQLMVALVRDELWHSCSLIHHPLIGEHLRRTVLGGLLLAAPHRYHAELTAPAAPGPPRAIRRAMDAIHDEPERAFEVSDLADIAGVSVRSLQEGFRRHLGSAPMTYLRQVRLTHAHDALRRADPTRVTVAGVAHQWGFAHLGRFAAAYRKAYGQSPSETLRQPG